MDVKNTILFYQKTIKKIYDAIALVEIDGAFALLMQIVQDPQLDQKLAPEIALSVRTQQARWQALKRDKRDLVLSYAEASLAETRLIKALLELIDSLQEELKSLLTGKKPDATRNIEREAKQGHIDVLLTLDTPFATFDKRSQSDFLQAVQTLLAMGSTIQIKQLSEGSVIVRLELSFEEAAKLILEAKNGALDRFSLTQIHLEEAVPEQVLSEEKQVQTSATVAEAKARLLNWVASIREQMILDLVSFRVMEIPQFRTASLALGDSELERIIQKSEPVEVHELTKSLSKIQEDLKKKREEILQNQQSKGRINRFLWIALGLSVILFVMRFTIFSVNIPWLIPLFLVLGTGIGAIILRKQVNDIHQQIQSLDERIDTISQLLTHFH